MGKGIAKTFKTIYPEMFTEYQHLCESKKLTIGHLHLFPTPHKWVLNFPTKRHWRNPSRLDDIRVGLEAFVKGYETHRVASISFPQLGCGNGGLDWEKQVRPLMEHHLSSLPIDVFIHIYANGTLLPEHLDRERMIDWLRSEPTSLPFGEVWRELITLIVQEKVSNWSLIDRDEPILQYEHEGVARELAYSDLLDLWQRFRRFGFLTLNDLSPELRVPSAALMQLLSALPFVAKASVATIVDPGQHQTAATEVLLSDANAQGLRLIEPLIAVPDVASLIEPDEDDEHWERNRTLKQSAFA